VWASASRAAKRWIADADGHVRLAYGESGAEGYFLYRRAQGEPWVDVGPTERFPLDAMTFVPLGFTNDPRKIYVSARIDSDRFAIHEFDIESRRFSPPIFSHPHYDVTGPLRFSTGEDGVRKLVAIEYQADYQETHWVDGGWREMMKEIHQALPGRVAYVLGTSSDGGVILLLVISDRHPGTYYVHRPTEGMLVPFVDRRPQLDPQHMVEVRPVQYRARDGLLIPGYLALPRGSEGKRVPVIVNPHGGPWVRDDREFDPVLQFFANRGWAVFRPNFRGSTGFGLTFQKMGYRQWGKAMQQDITDGVRWLIDQGIADPGRICIYGTSYGGYAALLGAVESPDLYRCAASYAAATDLAELLSDRNQREDNQLWTRLIGDRKEDRERLRLASPVHRASAIRIPVLMAHGKEDRVIRASHTREMARALSRSGRLEELMLFDDEGHGLHHERNRLEYYGRLEQFMARHLGAPRAARTASSPPAPAPAPVYTPVGGQ
jgi:dipeptidyl aminopeptidase/acylaminoacyl peptidase